MLWPWIVKNEVIPGELRQDVLRAARDSLLSHLKGQEFDAKTDYNTMAVVNLMLYSLFS